jgi:hypothetical protein
MSIPLAAHGVLKQPGLTSIRGTSDIMKVSVTTRPFDYLAAAAQPLLRIYCILLLAALAARTRRQKIKKHLRSSNMGRKPFMRRTIVAIYMRGSDVNPVRYCAVALVWRRLSAGEHFIRAPSSSRSSGPRRRSCVVCARSGATTPSPTTRKPTAGTQFTTFARSEALSSTRPSAVNATAMTRKHIYHGLMVSG